MYLAFGEAGAAVVPFAFPVLIALNLEVFMVRGWYSLFRIGQLLLILILPFLLTLALGGFVSSSAVIFWSMLTPLVARSSTPVVGRRPFGSWPSLEPSRWAECWTPSWSRRIASLRSGRSSFSF